MTFAFRSLPLLAIGLATVVVAGEKPDVGGFYGTVFERTPSAAAMTALGRKMFFDPSLSASGRQSCASCHDPRFAFGPPNDRAVQRGGVDGKQPFT